MSAIWPIAAVTLRALVGRRRTLLLVLLAALPVLVALLARLGGGRIDEAAILDALVVRAVLPLSALILGTAALGSELEDGTAVYIMTKPVPRWQVVAAKLGVAALLAAGLAVASTVLTGLVSGLDAASIRLTLAVSAAVVVGAAVYGAAFVAVSAWTSRALIVGLLYTLIWEGVLAGILEGTRILSIRESVLGLASSLAPPDSFEGGLEIAGALSLTLIVLVGGFALATARLRAFEVRGGD